LDESTLPEEETPVSLADEATETKCIVKSGEIIYLGKNSIKMPDGTIRTSIKDCKLEVGSSMAFEYTENKQTQFVNAKPRKKVHEVVTIPVPLPDPTRTPTSVDAYVAESIVIKPSVSNKFGGFDPLTATLLGLAAIAAIAIASIINFTNAKTAKLKKIAKSRIDRFDQLRKKKQEEQKKCNSKSENVKSLIQEVDLIVENSFVNDIRVEQNKKFLDKSAELNKEMAAIYKKINKLEDDLTKVKNKRTNYKTKGR
jgi:ribosome-associated translation inhibitor RaiA